MIEQWRDYLRARAIQLVSNRQSRGQSFVEYVLIILFVALAVALALSLLGPEIAAIFSTISSAL
jgi:Flp pilus assembly pilin Flp